MSGVFVPLDAEYDSDDKIIEAGHLAELLYVRGLAFAKRTMSDGRITHGQLAIVGRGIPSAKRHASALVSVGLWTETSKGFQIAAWAKRNKSAADIERVRTIRKAASIEANHQRWHTGRDGKLSATCPLCHSDTPSDTGSQIGSVNGSTEPEPEPEGEPKPEPEGQLRKSPTSLRDDVGELGEVIRNLFPRADSA